MMISTNIKHYLFAFFLSSIFYLLSSTSVFAQPSPFDQANFEIDIATDSPTIMPKAPTSGINLLLSPPILNLKTKPGIPISNTIKLRNFNNHPENLEIKLLKFRTDITGAKPIFEEINPNDPILQWISFSENKFTIDADSWKLIQLNFSPPENAEPSYYFAISFVRQQETQVDLGAVAQGQPTILCLSTVLSSRVHHQLDLAQLGGNQLGFKTDRKIYEFLPVNFETSLTNIGNVHELAFGNIFIDWVSGKQTGVDTLEVNTEHSYILPQTTRSFYSQWNNGFPHWEDKLDDSGNPILNKNGKTIRKLTWDFNKIPTFRIGKYRATLVMAYYDGVRDVPMEAETSFWVIPWRILLALLVILLLLFFGLKNLIQSSHKRLQRLRHRQPNS